MSFNQTTFVELPIWANDLKRHYWSIRVEGRDQAKRRKYYRLVEKEKLKLAEAGICQHKIKAVARYLSGFKNHEKLRIALSYENPQLRLF